MNRWYLDENDKDIYFKDEKDIRWGYNQKELVRILNDLETKLVEQPKQIVEKIREKIVDYNIKYSSAVDVLNCLDLVLDNLLKEMK